MLNFICERVHNTIITCPVLFLKTFFHIFYTFMLFAFLQNLIFEGIIYIFFNIKNITEILHFLYTYTFLCYKKFYLEFKTKKQHFAVILN